MRVIANGFAGVVDVEPDGSFADATFAFGAGVVSVGRGGGIDDLDADEVIAFAHGSAVDDNDMAGGVAGLAIGFFPGENVAGEDVFDAFDLLPAGFGWTGGRGVGEGLVEVDGKRTTLATYRQRALK